MWTRDIPKKTLEGGSNPNLRITPLVGEEGVYVGPLFSFNGERVFRVMSLKERSSQNTWVLVSRSGSHVRQVVGS